MPRLYFLKAGSDTNHMSSDITAQAEANLRALSCYWRYGFVQLNRADELVNCLTSSSALN